MSRAGVAVILGFVVAACARETRPVVVGSKNFTESVLLGELVAQTLESAGCSTERRLNLGGTLVCDKAIESGAVDVYVEYSGTALTAILARPVSSDSKRVTAIVREAYAARGLAWGPALGFDNTFAMLVRKSDSQRLHLATIGDLRKVALEFRPGFGYEFTERPDGWTGLQRAYGFELAQRPVAMDLGLTYRALAAGEVDLIAGNSTDGLIESLGLVVLQDDRAYFPPYEAAIVTAGAIDAKCPGARAALDSLAGRIDDAAMRRLNFEVDGRKRDVGLVVEEFRRSVGTQTPKRR
ncbi:MAG: ABC transporter substrate-binding protein [Acidobacteria bacterium]|nr:ABC transporter substrate-binding protein [Acidobacteriota bacterium]